MEHRKKPGTAAATTKYPSTKYNTTKYHDAWSGGSHDTDARYSATKTSKYHDICNNCGKHGHTFKQCKNPITSYGVIMFRIAPNQERQYLMIRRKDTLGYVDFMRGKYSASNQKYILNMLRQMTIQEKEKLQKYTFDELWYDLWKESTKPDDDDSFGEAPVELNPKEWDDDHSHVIMMEDDAEAAAAATIANRTTPRSGVPPPPPPPPATTSYNTYRQEEMNSREKFNYLTTKCLTEVVKEIKEVPNPRADAEAHPTAPATSPSSPTSPTILQYLIECSHTDPLWTEPEWGFPKGRRNFQEKDYDCALREMTEETGYPIHLVKNIKNILPFDEIFLGSNYKSYKHKYYLMFMNYEDSLNMDNYDKSEVSMMRWKSYQECLACIRDYNQEKKRLISHIESTLGKYRIRGVL